MALPAGRVDDGRVLRSEVVVTLSLSAVVLLVAAAPAQASTVNPHLAAFVQVFANGTPAVVRCADSAEEDWASENPNLFGLTYTSTPTAVVEFRADLCLILDDLAMSTADDSTKALAVLVLVHESYHVRHWAWRQNEAQAECQAIRHFRVGVRVLGGSRELADRLFPFALRWHTQMTELPEYRLDSCVIPLIR